MHRNLHQHRVWLALPLLTLTAALVCASAVASDRAAAAGPQPELRFVDPGPQPFLPLYLRTKTAISAATLEETVDLCMADNMASVDTPGAAVAVMVDGEIVYEQGYGVRSIDYNLPVTADTVFRIGSLTKQMTAAAVMQLVEANLVDLDDPVTDYVPEFEVGGPWSVDQMTVHRLLTHATGFPDQVIDLGPTDDDALSEWAADQGDVPLHVPPGAFYNYSNPNYALAGLVAERAAGMPYRDLIEERVWEAAGLTSMTFDPYRVVSGLNYASGHQPDIRTGELIAFSPALVDSGWVGPAGLGFSTAGDLVRWARILMDGGGDILSDSSAAAMQDPQVWMHQTPEMSYGYGIVHEHYPNIDLRWHDGSWIGWGAMLLWEPHQRFAVAVLSNTATPLSGALACIADSVIDLSGIEPVDYSTPVSTWSRYVGEYEFMDVFEYTFDARVALEGSILMIDIEDRSFVLPGVYTEMVQVALDTFFIDTDGDGVVETDLTFIGPPGTHQETRWLRNRYAVGARLFPVRRPVGRVGARP